MPQVLVGDAQRDPRDPGAEVRLAAKAGQRAEDANERLLDQVFQRRARAQHAVKQPMYRLDLETKQPHLSRAITRGAGPREILLLGGSERDFGH